MNNKLVFKRSLCPLTNALDILGDKWTLLVVRDLVLGKERYQEFLSSPEKISTNILADKLKRLQETGIVVRKSYQYNPVHYEYVLTKKGGAKANIEIHCHRGIEYFPGTKVFPTVRQKD